MKSIAILAIASALAVAPTIKNETLVGEPQPTLAQMILAMITGGGGK